MSCFNGIDSFSLKPKVRAEILSRIVNILVFSEGQSSDEIYGQILLLLMEYKLIK